MAPDTPHTYILLVIGGERGGLSENEHNFIGGFLDQRYEALHEGGWVAKTSKKSVTYFMDGP